MPSLSSIAQKKKKTYINEGIYYVHGLEDSVLLKDQFSPKLSMNLMQFQSKCQQAFWQNQQADSLNFIRKSKGTEIGQSV